MTEHASAVAEARTVAEALDDGEPWASHVPTATMQRILTALADECQRTSKQANADAEQAAVEQTRALMREGELGDRLNGALGRIEALTKRAETAEAERAEYRHELVEARQAVEQSEVRIARAEKRAEHAEIALGLSDQVKGIRTEERDEAIAERDAAIIRNAPLERVAAAARVWSAEVDVSDPGDPVGARACNALRDAIDAAPAPTVSPSTPLESSSIGVPKASPITHEEFVRLCGTLCRAGVLGIVVRAEPISTPRDFTGGSIVLMFDGDVATTAERRGT